MTVQRDLTFISPEGLLPDPGPYTETLVLDPTELTTRTPFDLTPFVSHAGPDYGDAAISQYLAESGRVGQVAIDYTIPNRTITIPLTAQGRGDITFEQLRTAIQRKVGHFQAKGGFLKRTTQIGEANPYGEKVYAEIVGATLKLGGSSEQAQYGVDVDAVLTLSVIPDWFGDEIIVDLTTSVFTGYASAIVSDITGDLPARVRIRVTDQSGNDQRALIWGMREGDEDLITASTAVSAFQAEDLTRLGATAPVSVTGQSGSSVVRLQSIPPTAPEDAFTPTWSPVVSTTLSSGDDMTHIGSYRVWVRAQAPRGSIPPSITAPTVSLALNWDIGDLKLGTQNDSALIPAYDAFFMLDLGQIRVDQAPLGQHRWQGKIVVSSLQPGGNFEDVMIDQVFVVPVGQDTYGKLSTTVAGDAVILNGQAVEIRTDGVYREAHTGFAYGPISRVIGDLPRLPLGEGTVTEVFVKPTQGDFATKPDSGIDSFVVQILYRPSYLFVPEV